MAFPAAGKGGVIGGAFSSAFCAHPESIKPKARNKMYLTMPGTLSEIQLMHKLLNLLLDSPNSFKH
jgi:hypothetical protein